MKYITSHPKTSHHITSHRLHLIHYISSIVSWATFLALRPFYVRTATKAVEVCCCEDNLHARWSVNALIKSCKKTKYWHRPDKLLIVHFFNFITSECPTEERVYISWDCTPDTKTLCASIINKWESFQKKKKKSHILKEEST